MSCVRCGWDQMYAKAMKKPYTAGPAYRPGEQAKSSSSSNPETAPINEVRL